MKRREFLKLSVICSTFLYTNKLFSKNIYLEKTAFNDLYKKEFAFLYTRKENHGKFKDDVIWDIWTNKGSVLREKQLIDNENIKRGDNLRASYSSLMYQQDRILYPLKRRGERGEGKWQRIDWEEAIEEIYNKLNKNLQNEQQILIHAGGGLKEKRYRITELEGFQRKIDSLELNYFSKNEEYKEYIDYRKLSPSETIIFWGANPLVTNMSEIHLLTKMKYRGLNILSITPEFNATSKISDIWFSLTEKEEIKILKEMIYQTVKNSLSSNISRELGILVRTDNFKLLSRFDLEEPKNGYEYIEFQKQFYFWDAKKNCLSLDSFESELEGLWEIKLFTGVKTEVTTLYQILKNNIESYHIPASELDMAGKSFDFLFKEILKAKKLNIVTGHHFSKEFILHVKLFAFLLGAKHCYTKNANTNQNRHTEDILQKDLSMVKSVILAGESIFRKNSMEFKKSFLNNVEFFVYLDTRFSESSIYADILLPVKGDYEVEYTANDIVVSPSLNPVGESKSEDEIFSILSKRFDSRADKRREVKRRVFISPLEETASFVLNYSSETLQEKREYPFLLYIVRSRWSKNSTYKTNRRLLKLQRGEPVLLINTTVAREKGLKDNDVVMLSNEKGEIRIKIKMTIGLKRDILLIEHGWEEFVFEGKGGLNRLFYEDINNKLPVNLQKVEPVA